MSIVDLKEGDKVTVTYSYRSGKDAMPYLCSSSATVDGLEANSVLVSGTKYTMGSDGRLDLYFNDNNVAIHTVTIQTEGSETITAPSLAVTGANNGSREITVTNGTSTAGNAVTTYYTTDGTEPTTESTQYTEPFLVDASCTVKAISANANASSPVSSLEVTAGTTLSLATPNVFVSAMAQSGSVYTPVLSATVDNSAVVGAPVATLTAEFNGAQVELGSGFRPDAEGTLVVTASADGYSSTSAEIAVSQYYMLKATYDLSDTLYAGSAKEWGENTAGRWANFNDIKAKESSYNYYVLTSGTVFSGLTFDKTANSSYIPTAGVGYSASPAVVTIDAAQGTDIGEFTFYSSASLSSTYVQYVVNSSSLAVALPRTSESKAFKGAVLYSKAQDEEVSEPTIAYEGGEVSIEGGVSTWGAYVATYYTTDGTTPTPESTPYEGTFTPTENCTVKAISISPNAASQVVSLDVELTVTSVETPNSDAATDQSVYTLSGAKATKAAKGLLIKDGKLILRK